MQQKILFFFLWLLAGSWLHAQQVHPDARFAEGKLLNQKMKGFIGFWYANQPVKSEYVYKYGGGLSTYTANHNPLAIYVKKVNKTFFCFGSTSDSGSLIYAISYYDHKKKVIAQPTAVFDKHTTDAHDNPVMSIDKNGYIWIFGTSHGVWRPSYVLRSKFPYDIESFEVVNATKIEGKEIKPLDNFSYLQVYYDTSNGFIGLFTHYIDKQFSQGPKMSRVTAFMTSKDGVSWSEWKDIASIDEGHYQTSYYADNKVSTAFNYHPYTLNDIGLNYRTNLWASLKT